MRRPRQRRRRERPRRSSSKPLVKGLGANRPIPIISFRAWSYIMMHGWMIKKSCLNKMACHVTRLNDLEMYG